MDNCLKRVRKTALKFSFDKYSEETFMRWKDLKNILKYIYMTQIKPIPTTQ